jgi:hypothetical protein
MAAIIEEIVEEAERSAARLNTLMPMSRSRYVPQSCPP